MVELVSEQTYITVHDRHYTYPSLVGRFLLFGFIFKHLLLKKSFLPVMCLLLQFRSLFTLSKLPRSHPPHEERRALNSLTWAGWDCCSQIKQKNHLEFRGQPRMSSNKEIIACNWPCTWGKKLLTNSYWNYHVQGLCRMLTHGQSHFFLWQNFEVNVVYPCLTEEQSEAFGGDGLLLIKRQNLNSPLSKNKMCSPP